MKVLKSIRKRVLSYVFAIDDGNASSITEVLSMSCLQPEYTITVLQNACAELLNYCSLDESAVDHGDAATSNKKFISNWIFPPLGGGVDNRARGKLERSTNKWG